MTEISQKIIIFAFAMSKRLLIFIFLVLLVVTSCDKRTSRLRQKILNGARVGLLASSMQEHRAKNLWPEASYRSFPTNDEVLKALKLGEVDAVYTDELVMYNKCYDKSLFELAFIDNDRMPIAGGLRKSEVYLAELFSDFLRKIKSNGEYVRLKNHWTMTENIDSIAPMVFKDYSKGPFLKTLHVGIIGEMRPYSIKNKGQWTGFENDLWTFFAQSIGYKIQFVVYDFNDLIQALLNKKVDVIAAAITVTQERESKILFTQPYAHSCSICLVKK